MRGTLAALFASFALASCSTAEKRPAPGEIEVTPDVLQACCDQSGTFPQYVGVMKVVNDSVYELEIRAGSDPLPWHVDPGNVGIIEVYVESCGDQDLAFELMTSPPTTHVIAFDDACPRRTEDGNDGLSQPALDLLYCDAAHDAEDRPWVACQTGGAWPPSPLLYSWFISIAVAADGALLADCTVQRHDGVDSQFCDLGDMAGLRVWFTRQGAILLFPVGPATDYQVDTGYMETPSSTFYSDDLMGTFDPDEGPIAPPTDIDAGTDTDAATDIDAAPPDIDAAYDIDAAP